MRIALLQLDPRLADPEANGRAIEVAYGKALAMGAQLVVAPELAVPGYFAEDRLWEPELRRRIVAESWRLASISSEVPLVLGTCSLAPSGRLWNELWWCEQGAIRTSVRKRILAVYDVYDEGRYFDGDLSPQPLVEYLGERVGLSIREDLWTDQELANGSIRQLLDPITELASQGATLLINASASSFSLGSYLPPGRQAPWAVPSKRAIRRQMLQTHASLHGVPIAYVSRVGADGGLIFDGGSCLVLPDGTCQMGSFFQEDIVLVDTQAPGHTWPEEPSEGLNLRRALVLGLKDNLAKQGLEAVVVGLSGGIDSAVVAALATEALGPERVLGVALPTGYTSAQSLSLAEEQAHRLGIHFRTVRADAPFRGAEQALQEIFPQRIFSLTDENLQSRARGMLLMALTTEPHTHSMLGSSRVAVLNTGNKSEAATGYFTLYGDGIGALGLLGDCLKGRVFALARELGEAVPRGVLERKPTAELRPDQTDEASLLPYAQLDAILGAWLEARRDEATLGDDLALLLEGQGLEQARAELPRILRLLKATEFKRRQLPFALKVAPWVFGRGRRVPLTGA